MKRVKDSNIGLLLHWSRGHKTVFGQQNLSYEYVLMIVKLIMAILKFES